METTVSSRDISTICKLDPGKRTFLPVAGIVRIEANGRLVVDGHGGNLALSWRYVADCQTVTDGEVRLPFTALKPYAKGTGVKLSTSEGDKVRFEAKNGAATCSAWIGELPVAKHVEEGQDAISMPAEEWDAAFAAANAARLDVDEKRPHLSCLAVVTWADGGTRACATDGHRLAAYTLSEHEREGTSTIVVPAAICDAWSRVGSRIKYDSVTIDQAASLDGKPGSVTVRAWRLDEERDDVEAVLTLTAPGIDDRLPDYSRVIPSDTDARCRVTVDAEELRAACKAVAPYASDLTGGVGLKHTGELLALWAETPGGGRGDAKIAVKIEGGAFPEKLAVKFGYLLDAVGKKTKGEVTLSVQDALDPILVTRAEDPAYVGLVMPMRCY